VVAGDFLSRATISVTTYLPIGCHLSTNNGNHIRWSSADETLEHPLPPSYGSTAL